MTDPHASPIAATPSTASPIAASPSAASPTAGGPRPNAALVVVIGAGPAGLMAADVCAAAGLRVRVYDRMPSAGRKFLLAGRGGLNLTHSETIERFVRRYRDGDGREAERWPAWLEAFGADDVRAWAAGLGIETFVGTSGRVFPTQMKAAPLLRAWLHRLRDAGVQFRMRHRWDGWAPSDDAGRQPLRFTRMPAGAQPAPDEHDRRSRVTGRLDVDGDDVAPAVADDTSVVIDDDADAVILALGGASWPRLGSDGRWQALLSANGIDVAPLQPANCGFDVGWPAAFSSRYAGAPVKSVAIRLDDRSPVDAQPACVPARTASEWQRGEFVVTQTGIEGSLVYTVAAELRDRLARGERARLFLDLRPDVSESALADALSRPRGKRSQAHHLRTRAGIEGVKAGLLREATDPTVMADPVRLAAAIKRLPIEVRAPRPIDEAISSAGGVRFDAMSRSLMLGAHPGTFCAGEMLDWEAPTGGYLLTGCWSTAVQAARGAVDWLRLRQ